MGLRPVQGGGCPEQGIHLLPEAAVETGRRDCGKLIAKEKGGERHDSLVRL